MTQVTKILDANDGPLTWSTDQLPAGTDPLRAWQARLSGLILPLRAESPETQGFQAHSTVASYGPLAFHAVRGSRQWLHWDAEHIAAGDAHWVFVSTMTEGTGWLHTARGSEEVPPGAVTLADSRQPCSLEFRDRFGFVSALVERDALLDIAPLAALAHGCVLPPPSGAALGALLGWLPQSTNTPESTPSPVNAQRVHDHFLGLVAAEVEAVALAREDGLSNRDALLLGQIKNQLLASLSTDAPSGAQLADALSISERKVQRLFQAENTTLGRWVLDQRLERIRRDLVNPHYRGDSIGDIAARWGITDPAYFSRCFRHRHGQPPAAYRQARAWF